MLNHIDQSIVIVDHFLRLVFDTTKPTQIPSPIPSVDSALSLEETRLSSALMRVNHAGEVSAQGLYLGQALASKNPTLQALFWQAKQEEAVHIAWLGDAMRRLNTQKSRLTPVWFVGSLLIGYLAGRLGDDAHNLGFMRETERQVQEHLQKHLHKLPANDIAGHQVLTQIQQDEARHAEIAETHGASELSTLEKLAMRLTAKVMTTVAYYV